MSLIDEALKKARQEAARQDAAEREARYARVPTYVPPVRRDRPWILPAVVAACLAVGVGAGVVLRGPHPLSPSSASPHPLPGPLPLAPSPARPPAPSPSGRGGAPAEAPVKAEQQKPIEKPAPKPVIKEPVVEELPAPAPAPTPALPAPVGPVIELPQPAEPRSYVREVPVEGGGTIRLNGIAMSAKPVALFGDKVIAPGESINGFTVLEIEAKRVKLQGPTGLVYVSLQ